jgi:hypothetical protein
VVALHRIDDVEVVELRDRRVVFDPAHVDAPLQHGHQLVAHGREAPLGVPLLHAPDGLLDEAVDDLILMIRVGGVLLVGVVEDELHGVEAVLLADVDRQAEAGVALEVRAGDDRRCDLVLEVALGERSLRRRGAAARPCAGGAPARSPVTAAAVAGGNGRGQKRRQGENEKNAHGHRMPTAARRPSQ